MKQRLVGADQAAPVSGVDELPGKTNYFFGDDPDGWITDVPLYSRVRYEGVYPGVDVEFYGIQGQLEYDIVVAPGADAGQVLLDFAGVDSIGISGEGSLVLSVPAVS